MKSITFASLVLLASGLSCRAVPFIPYAASAPRSSPPAKTAASSSSASGQDVKWI
jgi:hypothetical protein